MTAISGISSKTRKLWRLDAAAFELLKEQLEDVLHTPT